MIRLVKRQLTISTGLMSFIVFLVSVSPAQANEKTALFLDFLAESGIEYIRTPLIRRAMNEISNDLKKTHPDTEVIHLRASNPAELKRVVSEFDFRGRTISHLFIMAHGEKNLIYFGHEAFDLKSLTDSFDGIRHHLDDHSKVVFATCNILDGGRKRARKVAKKIIKLIGVKNGTIYGSSTTNGYEYPDFGVSADIAYFLGRAAYTYNQGYYDFNSSMTLVDFGFLVDLSLTLPKVTGNFKGIPKGSAGYLISVQESKIVQADPFDYRAALGDFSEPVSPESADLRLNQNASPANPSFSKPDAETTIKYTRNGMDHRLTVEKRGFFNTTIRFHGIGAISFNKDEAETVVKNLLAEEEAPRVNYFFLCGLSRCSKFEFSNGTSVSVYSSDAEKLLSVFERN